MEAISDLPMLNDYRRRLLSPVRHARPCTAAAPRRSRPFLMSPISSTTGTARGSPSRPVTQPRGSSRTASASQRARTRKMLHPARRRVLGVLGDRPAVLPRQARQQPKHERPRRRDSTLGKRAATVLFRSSKVLSHQPGSTLGPAATRRSLPAVTNRDDQTVAAPLPAPPRRKITMSGWSTMPANSCFR